MKIHDHQYGCDLHLVKDGNKLQTRKGKYRE